MAAEFAVLLLELSVTTTEISRDGVVLELLYAVGDQVGDGAELLRLQDAS